MCLSLRLRCLLLLNGGRQGDCVRVEFWLREALLQRKPPVGVGVGGETQVGCHVAAVQFGNVQLAKWRPRGFEQLARTPSTTSPGEHTEFRLSRTLDPAISSVSDQRVGSTFKSKSSFAASCQLARAMSQ